jgi:hypothetical protein
MKNEEFQKRIEVPFCVDHLDQLASTRAASSAVEAAVGDGDDRGGAER